MRKLLIFSILIFKNGFVHATSVDNTSKFILSRSYTASLGTICNLTLVPQDELLNISFLDPKTLFLESTAPIVQGADVVFEDEGKAKRSVNSRSYNSPYQISVRVTPEIVSEFTSQKYLKIKVASVRGVIERDVFLTNFASDYFNFKTCSISSAKK